MKKKINRQLRAVALGGVFITLVLAVMVFYNLFQEQVMADLRAYTKMLSQSELLTEDKFYDVLSDEEFRITIIDPEGNVRYDNRVDAQTLDNHAARPEVMGAWTCGEGESIRRSSTVPGASDRILLTMLFYCKTGMYSGCPSYLTVCGVFFSQPCLTLSCWRQQQWQSVCCCPIISPKVWWHPSKNWADTWTIWRMWKPTKN